MKKLFMAVIAFMMTISASAQFYIYFSDGTVAKVDSISMVAPADAEDPTNPDAPSTPSQGIGAFSVSATKQVTFSKGNLQYHPANSEWRFAESQLDYLGENNRHSNISYMGWIDLFGWVIEGQTSPVGANLSPDFKIDSLSSFVDWGAMQINQETPNAWRTLTYEEWNYLLLERDNYGFLCNPVQIDTIKGFMLLPDNWTCPNGVTFESNFKWGYNGQLNYSSYQIYTLSEWKLLEKSGAVFLPVAGYYNKWGIGDIQNVGYYWSSSSPYDNPLGVYCITFQFLGGCVSVHNVSQRDYGHSVRLVKDL